MNPLKALPLIMMLIIGGCASHYTLRPSEQVVELRLFSPFAERVFFYCSVNGFRAQPADTTIWRYWTIKVNYNEPFAYFYVVDGKVVVPDCALQEQDDFGSYNCIYQAKL